MVIPFTGISRCVTAELILPMDNNHPQFGENSSTIYDKIDKSFTGNDHASILKPFKKKKDGFGLEQQIFV